MGRNKKKSQAIVVDSVSSEEEDEIQVEESAKQQEVHSDPVPADHDSDNDEEGEGKKKKKKEYKGNKLSRQQGKKGKKGDEEEEKGNETSSKQKTEKDGDDAHGNDDEDDELVVTREYPVEVLYCPVCSFPAEMCEFSGMMEKCRPWLQEHAAELATAEEKGRKRRILTEQGRLEKLLEGGAGRKHVITRSVVVEVDDHDRKRQLTIVTGMDLFGFNLKDLSREWRKQFSAGAGVREAEEKHEQSRVEVQGNVAAQLGKLFQTKYKIPEECVFRIVKDADKKKRKVNFYDE